MVEGQVQRVFDFEASPSVQFATVPVPGVFWADVVMIQMHIVDDLGNRYTSYWSRQMPPAPVITGLAPESGSPGAQVIITGQNFGCDGCVGGVNSVRFSGADAPVSAQFTIDSPTQITATVPAGATTGQVRVQSIGGLTLSPGAFTIP
jgi:hypothetical protein